MRCSLTKSALSLGLLAGVALMWAPALQAQGEVTGRFQVLVYNMEPMEDADDDFGKDVAKELRKLINDLATHRPLEEKEIKQALRRLDVDEDDLNCIMARQLASQMQAAVVVCGSYTPTGVDREVELTTSFVTVETGESFEVPSFTISNREKRPAAQRVFNAFETQVEQQRHAHFCAEYAASQQWDNAMENCQKAIDLNPQGLGSIYTRGMVYMNQEDFESALADFDQVLEMNPIHENGLKAAGYTATKMGDRQKALGYYNQLLELDPAAADVRMNLAYDLAQAGDPYGAKVLIDDGLELDGANVDLHNQRGGYAMASAEAIYGEAGELTPESEALYREAIESYDVVYEARGDEVAVSGRRNVISAYQRLGDLAAAQTAAQVALQTWPDEAQLWSVNADVLNRMGRTEDAIAALDRVREIDPDYNNVLARKGMWLLESGDTEAAVAALSQAVESGEQDGDRIANLLFGQGHSQGVQPQAWGKAITLFSQAVDFATDADVQTKIRFWHGYSLLKQGQAIQDGQSIEKARQTRGMFVQAQRLLRATASYANQEGAPVNAGQIQNLIDAATQFLEIQDAVIRRGE